MADSFFRELRISPTAILVDDHAAAASVTTLRSVASLSPPSEEPDQHPVLITSEEDAGNDRVGSHHMEDEIPEVLFAAISEGNLARVQLVEEITGATNLPWVRAPEDDETTRTTALEYCMRYWPATDVFAYLATRPRVDVNFRDKTTGIPLLSAAVENLDLLQHLLQQPNIDLNAQDGDGNTALHAACQKNRKKALTCLLRHPLIDVHVRNNQLQTPLLTAIVTSDEKVLECVLHHTADQLLEFTSLEWLAKHRRWRLLHLILTHPPQRPFLARPTVQSKISQAFQWGGIGSVLLFWMIWHMAPIPLVQTLVSHQDFDINQADEDGDTPLLMAGLLAKTKTGLIQQYVSNVVNLLLQQTMLDVNAQDNHGNTALHFYVKQRNWRICARLLNQDAICPWIMNCEGYTPLHTAILARDCSVSMIEMLVVKHPDCINVANRNDGNTALHYTMKSLRDNVRSQVLAILLAQEMLQINAKDGQGTTALHIACERGQFDLVQKMLEHPHINIMTMDSKRCRASQVANLAAIPGEQQDTMDPYGLNLLHGLEMVELWYSIQTLLGTLNPAEQPSDIKSTDQEENEIDSLEKAIEKMLRILVDWLPQNRAEVEKAMPGPRRVGLVGGSPYVDDDEVLLLSFDGNDQPNGPPS